MTARVAALVAAAAVLGLAGAAALAAHRLGASVMTAKLLRPALVRCGDKEVRPAEACHALWADARRRFLAAREAPR